MKSLARSVNAASAPAAVLSRPLGRPRKDGPPRPVVVLLPPKPEPTYLRAEKPIFFAPVRAPSWWSLPIPPARTCQYQLWDHRKPKTTPRLVCGQPVVKGSWCAEHAKIVFEPRTGYRDDG